MYNHLCPSEQGGQDGDLMVALRSVLGPPQPSCGTDGSVELEARLQHLQKSAALGRAVLGVAHEFNNLLGVMEGYAELLHANPTLNVQAQEAVDAIRQVTDRASTLAQQLLSFGRGRPSAAAVTDLGSVVASIRQILRCVLGSAIRLVVVSSPEPCRVRVSASHVEQVLLNLVVNARDALQSAVPGTTTTPGGQVLISTGPVHLEQDYRHAHGVVPPGAYGRLVVSDTGCGMDTTTQARLFEPFYTTKEPGKGTGLGMAIVATLLQQSDGHISLWSERGRGTRFEVYWPLLGDGK